MEVEGTPVANHQVKLMHLEAPFTIALARTDEQGRAHFAPPAPARGSRAPCTSGAAKTEQKLEGDWEGLWASLSFEHGLETAPAVHMKASERSSFLAFTDRANGTVSNRTMSSRRTA
jgi:hypothetical protein